MPWCACSSASAVLSASSASAASQTGSDASYAHFSWGLETACGKAETTESTYIEKV